MKKICVTVKWPAGLHMRNASRLVRLAGKFRSSICLRVGSQMADARSILNILLLCAAMGTTVDVEASGQDEHQAIRAIDDFFDGDSGDGEPAANSPSNQP